MSGEQEDKKLLTGKTAVDFAVFGISHLLLGASIFQGMDATKYADFAHGIQNFAHQLGTEIDTDFFRYQMTDVFFAPYCAVIAKINIDFVLNAIPAGTLKTLIDNSKDIVPILIFGAVCVAYEIGQAQEPGRTLDVPDLMAYAAGLLIYLSRNAIFNQYLDIKDKIKDIPEFINHLQSMLYQQVEDYIRNETMVNQLQSNIIQPFFHFDETISLAEEPGNARRSFFR